MTSSFPPNVGNKCFLVSKATTRPSGGLNLTYPFNQFSCEIVVAGAPIADETIVIGSQTYVWKAAPAAANELDIGATTVLSASAVRHALIDGDTVHSDGTGEGTLYGAGTVINPDILHAELGVTTSKVHVTAASALSVAETSTGGSGNVTIQDLDGNEITTMVHYPQGDFTDLKANSAEANAQRITVTGMAPASMDVGTSLGDTSVKVYTHSGVPAVGLFYDTGGGVFGFRPTPIQLNEGLAAKLGAHTAEAGMYVFYH